MTALAVVFFAIASFASDKYKFDNNIAYKGTEDPYTSQMCRLDVAYKKGVSDRPVVIWFHGGGLTGGHRSVPQELLGKDYVVVGVGYRFVPNVKVEEIIDDAAAAVAWVYNNVEKYGGSKSKLYVAGHSAGGYLVSMIGLDKKYMAKYDIDPDSFAAVVPFSGQSITHFEQRKALGVDILTPLVDEMSPMFHVRGDAAPLLILSGDRELEMCGRYEENAYFVRMLRLKGHKDVTFYEFDGFGHSPMVTPGFAVLMRYIKERDI